MKTAFVVLFLALLFSGCASPTKQAPHQTDDTTISVTVRPLDQVHYEMIAVIQRREEGQHSRHTSSGEDRYCFPPVDATLDGELAELVVNGVTPDLGPRARLKVWKEAGRIIADYRAGYTDSKRSCFTEGRMEIAPK